MSIFDQSVNTHETIKPQRQLPNLFGLLSLLFVALAMSACQTAPSSTTSMKRSDATVMAPNRNDSQVGDNVFGNSVPYDNSSYDNEAFDNDDDYPIEPYNPPAPESERYTAPPTPQTTSTIPNANSAYTIPPYQGESQTFPEPIIVTPSRDEGTTAPPTMPSHSDLLERARANSQQQSRSISSTNSDLPAFRNLMQTGTNQLRANDLTAAENSFTRAQRLAPRSSAVYFYLSQVALKKNQPRKAEAMARRGLSVSQDSDRRRALWQIILRSGELQNNARVISEAQKALR